MTMSSRKGSDSRMPLNSVESVKEEVTRVENIFTEFENLLLSENREKLIKSWIFDNQDVLDGKFGKKLETPLHR